MRGLSFIILLAGLLSGVVIAQSPHGNNFKMDCGLCHRSVDWKVNPLKIKFNHSTTEFDLIGQHQAVDCRSCHETLIFSGAQQECISCHTDLHQGTVGKDCAKCHAPKSWMVQDINGLHQQGRFPLLGMHQTADCVQCHSRYVDLYFEPLNTECYACHSDDYLSSTTPNHTDAQFSTECQDCHDLNSSTWAASGVVHDFFPLIGGHALADCFSCHEQGGNFTGLSQECISCHEDDYNNPGNDPNHIAANFPTDCRQCHTIYGWSPSTFDHNATSFPLTGSHITAECSSCHSTGFTGTPTDCFACHESDFVLTTDPNHVASNFPTECAVCHNTTSWVPAQFDHNLTSFPLTGQHITVDCAQCHASGYTGTPADCYSCHQDDYDGTTDPDHQASAFPTTCEDCHSTSGWSPANFDHNFYPISNAHNNVNCNECHSEPNYQPQCLSCHLDKFNDGHDPGDPTDCWGCHSTSDWGTNFDHNNTNFPLTGAHTGTSCQDCHASGYQGTPTECFACHQTNYNNTTNPDHQALVLPTDCGSCHSTNPGWQPASFPIHSQFFELLGAHANISNCDNCHNGDFNNTPNTCIGCHQNDYNGTTDPPHQVLIFSEDCLICHNMNGWTPANFDHNFYSISSNHNNVNCNECHSESSYQPQCLSCHLDDFNNGHDPGDPTDCWSCHSTSDWNSNFDHNNTNFPLTGAHVGVACLDCHASGYQGTPTECFACHQTNYNNTTNPDHQALVLPTECETCHTTNPGWQPATFPIHNQFFELLGAHANIANCDDCHNGDYNNIINTCIGCHQNDYNGTTDPPHQVLNFSLDCLECHNMNGWTPANFDHNFYPISSNHNNVNCNECHSETSYQPQCLSCHLNNFNDGHDPGDPTDCWNCHTTSNWNTGPNLKLKLE